MVGLPAQREAITFLMNEFKVSERRACRAISVERSSIRYRKRSDKNIELKKRMIHWSEKRPSYGYPHIHEMILRDGFKVNHKRTERLYFKELKLALKGKKKKRRYRSEARVPISFPEALTKFGLWILSLTNLALVEELEGSRLLMNSQKEIKHWTSITVLPDLKLFRFLREFASSKEHPILLQ